MDEPSPEIQRLRGEVQQVKSTTHIQQVAEQLAGLLSSHHRNHHELLHIRQLNGVNGEGVVSVVLRVD